MFSTLRKSIGLSPIKSSNVVAITNSHRSEEGNENIVYGYLVLENSKGVETARYPLQKRITTFGRLPVRDIRIYEPIVSRLHCQICVDDNGKITFQVFNAQRVKLNGLKIQSIATASESKNLYPLQESDVIEVFHNRFRLEHVQKDDQGRNIIPKDVKLGRKSLRMSLVRAEVVEATSSNVLRESHVVLEEVESLEMSKEQAEDKTDRGQCLKQEEDKENAPIQRRRSFVFNTPSNKSMHKASWESEPKKKAVKRLNLSPVKGTSFNKGTHMNTAIDDNAVLVVMEEVAVEADENHKDDESEVMEVESRPDQSLELLPTSTLKTPTTPPSQEICSKRLTKSSSPKKARRRSSFFGRAGLFAGLNLGFYPEERRDNEEEKAVEGNLQVLESRSPSVSPDKNLPEPRLDVYGMPRLPRSMSSPSGLNYGSPNKRRIPSLRTATLMKNGQQVFEQRMLFSPPSSPTKTISSPALFLSPSPTKKAAAGQVPLPESDDDEDDADEVDKSLSSFGEDNDDEDGEEAIKAIAQPRFNAKKAAPRGPRKSHGNFAAAKSTNTKVKSRGKARLSLPGTLLSDSLVETSNNRAVQGWREEWEAKKQDGWKDRKDEPVSFESSLHNAFEKVQEEDIEKEEPGEEINLPTSMPVAEEEEQTRPMKSPVKRLRQMVQDSADLTALLDDITGEGQTVIDDVANRKRPSTVSPLQGSDMLHILVEDEVGKAFVPQDLLATPVKLSRRVSEQPQRKSRRRSSAVSKTMLSKPRKSAGAVFKSSNFIQQIESLPTAESNDETAQKTTTSELVAEEVTSFEFTKEEQPLTFEVKRPEETGDILVDPVPLQEIVNDATVDEQQPLQLLQKKVNKTRLPIATRETRAAKLAAAAAITGEGVSLRARLASESPRKKVVSSQIGPSSLAYKRTNSIVTSDGPPSDDVESSRLVLEPSSPTKRVKRAAKNKAEVKIKEVLTKKPSMTVVRDARTLSEVSSSKLNVPMVDSSKKEASTRSTRLLRKAASQINMQSEPTRTTRSRATRQQ